MIYNFLNFDDVSEIGYSRPSKGILKVKFMTL